MDCFRSSNCIVGGMPIVSRTRSAPETLAAVVRREVASIDREQPIRRMRTGEELLTQSVAQPRLYSVLLAVFSAVALALAGIGVYGVMTFAVGQRTQEMGLRIALGRRPGAVLAMVVRQGLGLAVAGVAIGLAGALAVTRVLGKLLYGIAPSDPADLYRSGAVVCRRRGGGLLSSGETRRQGRSDDGVALRVTYNRRMTVASRTFLSIFAACAFAAAQQPAPSPDLVEGNRLDLEGKSKEAKAAFQKAIDSASTPAAKLSALRGMAMSYAFDGDCRNTVKYQQMAIDHLNERQKDSPGSTFAQQGELANEAARVCIDAGDLGTAEQWYKKGRELGSKEPNISAARKALLDFRSEHAMARLAARRGNKAEAQKHVAAAQKALDQMRAADAGMHKQQESFLPYLTGYVAFYTGDLKTALADLQKANTQDPFVQCLIGMTYEKMGQKEQAMEWYKKASVVNNRTASSAFAKSFTRKKLGGA